MNIMRTKARVLLAAPFVVTGLDAIVHPDQHAKKVVRARQPLDALGVPEISEDHLRLASRAFGAMAVGAGLCLAFGKRQRTAAAALAAFTAPLALVNAPIWLAGDREERRAAGRALMGYGVQCGGLMFAAMDRGGKPSRQWRKYYQTQQREAVQAAIANA